MGGDSDQQFCQVPPIKRWELFLYALNLLTLSLALPSKMSGSDDDVPILNLTGLEDFHFLIEFCSAAM